MRHRIRRGKTMDDRRAADARAIEDLHERDVAATKLGDLDALESLMDPDCVLIPPEGEPEPGRRSRAPHAADHADPQTSAGWPVVRASRDVAHPTTRG
ncbi:MAG: hypothetical protein JXB46_11380 [Candidatus Eisenbacteria bacterium]|nr:hypothetical protein [Candidatus Eisenbacteria bacterium]